MTAFKAAFQSFLPLPKCPECDVVHPDPKENFSVFASIVSLYPSLQVSVKSMIPYKFSQTNKTKEIITN